MDSEQKYREALERAKSFYDNEKTRVGLTPIDLEYIFPELKESEGERIRKEIYQFVYEQRPEADWLAWLEKQDKQDVRYKHLEELLAADDIYQMSMNQEMVEGAKTKAINALSKLCISELLLKKQGEKPQGKSIIEAWKDMRLEVYQQASGNRHEPNCSDDNSKMFSLNDIDEIIEKINEQTEKQD